MTWSGVRLLSAALLLATLLVSTVSAISFDLQAFPASAQRGKRCLAHWVPRDTLIKGYVKASPGVNQKVAMTIIDSSAATNEYLNKKDLQDTKFAFTFRTQAHADVNLCFQNILDEGYQPDSQWKRTIELKFDFGAEAIDYAEIAKVEKLKPMDLELRRLENIVEEIVDEMDYLKKRESKMRDTNESTNERVWSFSLLSMIVLVSVGVWQVYYLRKFFQSKKLI